MRSPTSAGCPPPSDCRPGARPSAAAADRHVRPTIRLGAGIGPTRPQGPAHWQAHWPLTPTGYPEPMFDVRPSQRWRSIRPAWPSLALVLALALPAHSIAATLESVRVEGLAAPMAEAVRRALTLSRLNESQRADLSPARLAFLIRRAEREADHRSGRVGSDWMPNGRPGIPAARSSRCRDRVRAGTIGNPALATRALTSAAHPHTPATPHREPTQAHTRPDSPSSGRTREHPHRPET